MSKQQIEKKCPFVRRHPWGTQDANKLAWIFLRGNHFSGFSRFQEQKSHSWLVSFRRYPKRFIWFPMLLFPRLGNSCVGLFHSSIAVRIRLLPSKQSYNDFALDMILPFIENKLSKWKSRKTFMNFSRKQWLKKWFVGLIPIYTVYRNTAIVK